ncbi:MAG TPA: DHA2 family efflux MFS transporter permease subunit [Methanocorpusculum sp.]|nr:DHA2 family efflux MFS transporter permease subunit [Methanocorpusculum sp.]
MRIARQYVLLLIAIFIACVMDGLDGSIVNVALPVIAEAFNTDTGTVSWVGLAYLLMVAGTVLIFGRVAARGFIKGIFITGFVLFIISSLFCGFAPTLEILIAGRLIQGLGASMLVACAPLICVKYLPTEIMGLAFGVLTAATSVGFAFGPALGGILTHYLSWNWVFWINVPIGIAAVIYAARVIPKGVRDHASQKFDIRGALLLFAAMASLTYVLERLPHLGINDPQILIFGIICVVTFTLFIISSLRRTNPILNIRVFRLPAVTLTIIAYLIIQIVFAGLIYLLPFYFTNQFNADTLLCGILMLIQPVVSAVLSVFFGKWSDSYGRRIFCTTACVILTAIYGAFALLRPEAGLVPFILLLAGEGVCFAMANGPASSKIVDLMPKGEKESGSSLMMACVFLGAVVGTALFASVFTYLTMNDGVILSFAELPQDIFAAGFTGSMIFGTLLSVVSVILCAVVKDKRQE